MATEQAVQPRGARPRGRARERVEENVVEAVPSVEERSLSGEVVSARVTPIEWVLYSAFTVVGAVMRFWDLGSRALHHDESLHATYSWYLWQRLTGNGTSLGGNLWTRLTTSLGLAPEYHYDPMMHGPYQFHGNALMYLIFGVNDASVRLNAAICGTALIMLPFLLRRQIGRAAALILSALLAFSPAFLYYSRFSREDIYFALWTAVFFVGFMRWLDARGRPKGHRWLYMAAAGFALSWATKESTFFVTVPIVVGFVVGIFVVGYAYQFLAPRRARGAQAKGRAAAPAEHPVVAALGDFARANLPPLVDAFRGTPRRGWLGSLGIMAIITLVMYFPIGDPWQWGFIPGAHVQTTTNPAGQTVPYNTDAFTGGINYWLIQQGDARGSQPWYYYFLVIPLYEQVAVVFGAAGLVYYFLHRRTRLALASGAAFALAVLLTLFVGPSLPKPLYDLLALAMLASGVALFVSRPRSLLVNLMLWWTVVTWGLYILAGEKMPWLTLHILLPTFFVAALYLGHLFQAPRFSRKWLLTAVLLALTAIVSFRSSVALAYVDGANPTEMLVYTQTAQDVPEVSTVLHRIPVKPTADTGGHVYVDGNDAWPWTWYLHDDPTNHGWSSAEADLIAAAQQRYAVILVSSENHQAMVSDGKLAQFAGYTGYEFKLRWWFPEDYKDWETTGLSGFLGQVLQPSSWGKLVNWWATRTPFDQQMFTSWGNVYPFYVYVRSDLVKTYIPHTAFWAGARQRAVQTSQYTPAVLSNDVASALTRPAAPSLPLTGLPAPLTAPHGLTVDAAGNIYLTEPSIQRIVKLDRSGHYLTAWGSTGSGNGQFASAFGSGPMGVAVGRNGDIYVADTWNHRIQEFSPSGAFVRAFGGPNPASGPTQDSFYGPRQIAVAPNGNLYIADTGNKRIQVYSPTGQHRFNIGSGTTSTTGMAAPGNFDEPSGVAIDSHGTVYVADYWNKRVQRFTLSGRYLGMYTVAGWAPGDYNEPYLAVDNRGHLFATDAPTVSAHVNHVLELNATTGQVLKAFGDTTTAGGLVSPSGIAVGPSGSLYIADDSPTPRLLDVQP